MYTYSSLDSPKNAWNEQTVIIAIQKNVTNGFGPIGRGLNWFKARANKSINW